MRCRHWLVGLAAVTMGLGGAVTVGGPAAAQPATLYVSSSGNDTGNNCQTQATPCATINHALAVASAGDTIEVLSTIDEHVVVPPGLSSITISGALGPSGSAVVDGTHNGTVFTIPAGVTVHLEHLTIENGAGAGDAGGGVNNDGTLTVDDSTFTGNNAATYGGGINNGADGILTVRNSTFTGNTVTNGYGGGIDNGMGGTATVYGSTFTGNTGSGGGLNNDEGGTLTINDSIISGNTSPNSGGGIYALDGTVTVNRCTVTGNHSNVGGGMDLQNANAVVHIIDSTYSDNTSTDTGGGIDDDANAYLTITRSTFSGNSSSYGGGIYSDGYLGVTDSTFYGNTASEYGGGIFTEDGTAVITASTIYGNHAPAGFGPGLESYGGSTTVGATIIAGNTNLDGVLENCGGTPAPDSVGYNLTDDETGDACGFTEDTDVVGENPQLGPLADNGGPPAPDTPTKTLLPALTSPAVGQIPNPLTLNDVPVCGDHAADQRGVHRPVSPFIACTIGAVEVVPPHLRITKDGPATVAPGGTVRYELHVANQGPVAADQVTVSDVLSPRLTGISASPAPPCTVTGATVSCDFGTLAAGHGRAVVITARVTPATAPGTSIENCGTVSSTSPQVTVDDDHACTAAAVTAVPPVPPGPPTDVAITKTGPATAKRGAAISYTLTVTNRSGVTAQGTLVSDVFPGEVTVTAVPRGCTLAGRTLTCPVGRLTAGATRTFTVTARIHQVPLNSVVENCAAVYTTTHETRLRNNASCVQTLIPREVKAPALVPVTG